MANRSSLIGTENRKSSDDRMSSLAKPPTCFEGKQTIEGKAAVRCVIECPAALEEKELKFLLLVSRRTSQPPMHFRRRDCIDDPSCDIYFWQWL